MAPTTERKREYHVYDARMPKVAGVIVTERDGARIVLLTKSEARYFIDQGVIGETAHADLSSAHHETLSQISGGKIEKPDAKSDTVKPEKTAIKPVPPNIRP